MVLRGVWRSFPVLVLALGAQARGISAEVPCALREVAQRFFDAKARSASRAEAAALYFEFDSAARSLGSDAEHVLAALLHERFPEPASPPRQRISAAPCNGEMLTTVTFDNPSSVTIPDATSPAQSGWGTIESPIFVAGTSGAIWDVDVRTNLQHQRCNNLRVFVISPSGRSETLTTDNNIFGYADLFNGTLWDDSAIVPATDYPYVNGVAATAVVPEGALGAFVGEDPTGAWVLLMRDDTPGFTGNLNGWSLDITTISAMPPVATQSYFTFVNQGVPDAPNPGLTSSVTASALPPSIFDVNVSIAVTHSFPSDLAVFLTSPSGTTVTLTTYNGGNRDDVFNGTVFDDSAPTPATDYAYVPNTPAPFVIPDGALSAFMGENPNGVWTLRVRDDLAGDTGFFIAWGLEITTCTPAATGTPFCFGDGLDPNVTTPCPCANNGAAGHGCGNSAVAGGALLTATGTTSPDTVVLTASGMPATSTSIFLKGDLLDDAVYGDGVRCVAGNLIRLRTRINVGGAAQFPDTGDPLLSVRGQTPPGSGLTGLYQTYYRNAAAFCTPATFNISSGLRIVW